MDNLYQLNNNNKYQVQDILNKGCGIFDRTLGLWKGSLYKIELQDKAKPHHARPDRIQHAYRQMFKNEV